MRSNLLDPATFGTGLKGVTSFIVVRKVDLLFAAGLVLHDPKVATRADFGLRLLLSLVKVETKWVFPTLGKP